MSVAETTAPGPASDPAASLTVQLEVMRAAFLRDGPPDAGARRADLRRLESALLAERDAIVAAIAADFGSRAREETLAADLFVVISAIRHARRGLRRWMRPRRRRIDPVFLPARARLLPQPLGVVGIIAPWNYPVNLALSPLVATLAAGNRAMVKPSELTPHTAEVLADLLGRAFPAEQVAVVTGGAEVGAAFAALPFDHLLFTGSTAVGRKVMAAAAPGLTPVTLELGGKSPAIIGPGADLERAVRSIVQGKLFNAGQTCIAPDYVLAPADKVEAVATLALRTAAQFHPHLAGNPSYTAIVNERHAQRLRSLVEDAEAKGATVRQPERPGSDADAAGAERKLPLTVLTGVSDEMRVMREEIFGPLLPVLPYDDLQVALDGINAGPRPLALYLFDDDRATVDRVLSRTWSGGACVNETLLHAGIEDLPFGGVGDSGMGRYHGREGFETFSHLKPVLYQSRFNAMWMMRPPYGRWSRLALRLMLGRAAS